ncbi:hypothetical protein Fcan01_20011 [Folsomia candida]|uniref:Uncharacterized protein n=1 Tax=Folsomia candida TaxID=158441 RepID=A0A226DL29_FOLCA|nr:hypothetical protein Fcan01_20011 [Folsomia candida]
MNSKIIAAFLLVAVLVVMTTTVEAQNCPDGNGWACWANRGRRDSICPANNNNQIVKNKDNTMQKLCIVVLIIVTMVHCRTKVSVWENPGYTGRGSYFDDLDGFPHGKLGLMANLVSSLKIDIGSCVEAYEYDPPGGEWFWTTETAIYQLDDALDNRISSLKSCGRYTVELHCPSGTFVKRIEWDGKNSLRGGLKLHCVPYSSTTVVSTLSLHDSLATTQAKDCLDAMRGIQFSRSNVLEVDYAMEPDCNPGYTYGNSIYCGSGSALIGVWMQVENRCVLLPHYIKTSRILCSPWISRNTRGSEIDDVKVVEPLYRRNFTRSAIINGAATAGQDGAGKGAYFEDLDRYSYGTLGPMNNIVATFTIDIGSCVLAYDLDPPGGEWFWASPFIVLFFDPEHPMYKRISSMKSCSRRVVDLKCPSGTFVKRIEWDGNGTLRLGLRLHCMEYSSNTANKTLELHEIDDTDTDDIEGLSSCYEGD